MTGSCLSIRIGWALAAWAAACTPMSAAIVAIHEFDVAADPEGWEAAGDLASVTQDAFGGGALRGDFDSQGMFFTPTTGSFRLDEPGADFLGAYPGAFQITGFSFDLFAAGVNPLDINLRLFSGMSVNFFTLNIAGRTWGGWENFVVALDDPLWQGNAAVLNNVTAVEVQIARGSAAAQTFYLDNFETLSSAMDPAGLVPEPSTMMMFLNAGLVVAVLRRRALRKAPGPKEAA